MIPSDGELARGSPRRGARVVRCERACRLVRAYSRDLVVQAEEWHNHLPSGSKWEAWESVSPVDSRDYVARPVYSNNWRRKMCLKEMTSALNGENGLATRKTSYGKASLPGRNENRPKPPKERDEDDEARWGSLAGKEWSLFEEGGFDLSNSNSKLGRGDMRERLQFDMTESAKMVFTLASNFNTSLNTE